MSSLRARPEDRPGGPPRRGRPDPDAAPPGARREPRIDPAPDRDEPEDAEPTPPRPARAAKPAARRGKAPPKPKRRRGWLGFLAKWLVVFAIWGAIGLGGLLAYFAYDLPAIGNVVAPTRRPSITILAADGSQIARLGDLGGNQVDAARLPPHVVQALLAIEDRRFFSHFGVDPVGLARALWTNYQAGRTVQGGSTITQQLAKNVFLTPDQTLRRKVQEALLALWLERNYSKNEILSAYLNRAYFGAGAYGIDAAAQTYFGKPIAEVNLREAATLAGLLKAPSRFAPSRNPEAAARRADVVLNAMVAAGFLRAEDLARLAAAPLAPPRPAGPEIDGRYLADWVAEEAASRAGTRDHDLIVKTTIDTRMQAAAERHVAAFMASKEAAAQRAGQAAIVTLAPDGAILAMVGGRNYDGSQFNRATRALRQPGSAFKPFVYLAALQRGWSPDSPIEDVPLRIGKWAPGNFDNRFHGVVSLRDALAHSYNVPAVRLMDSVGVDAVRGLAADLGIGTPLGRDLSLALGTGEVTVLEMATAYAAFANGGTAVFSYAVTEIADRDGRVLYRRQGDGPGFRLAPGPLQQLVQMMTGVVEYGTGRAARLDRAVAGKTGTTNDYRDAWFVGYTPAL
ncbi:MAG TPA: PBP1A family penicillin-binding protein, partial [Alphaproteobacteria bacterium]|nr:PBP1A family penicillin-binding protein [Alphaproteobacteria bacterium]